MTRMNTLFAATLLSLATAPALAASNHTADIAACRKPADRSASTKDVDCRVTGSVGESDEQTPKADRYPAGPSNMGAGLWL
ncbi:hypothetical protein DFR52_102282 [Hoeflea marina]|uniref:DUF680 domain-containing protein n=1 Tax=Hoeflea marina TaxID=274592 RepID=A0A317PMX9_9HYPH|nr:hypothetical protein [Hoeflea marina]PWW01619.1 hypothetical protein DFR52_102282 [Hoeflea marina]